MTSTTTAPDFTEVFEELDAGIFGRKVSHALSETAMAVVNAESRKQTGKLTLEFNIERIGEGAQVNMTHKLTYQKPTLRGKVNETDETQTLLYVGKGGKLTVTPDTQLDLIQKTQREVV